MKAENMILIGGGLIAAFIIFRAVRKPKIPGADSGPPLDYSKPNNAWQGWNQYTNGALIVPINDYFSTAQMAWRAGQ